MTCIFGHDSYIISTETLISTPFYGFTFWRCHRCKKCKIDSNSFKSDRKGKWRDKWTDDGGIMPEISLPDKNCPKCDKKMKKSTAFGGEWTCWTDSKRINIHDINAMKNTHYETIKAKPEDYLEV